MQTQIQLKAVLRPETLERILRVIRHRGFQIIDLHAMQKDEYLTLTATIQSDRAISLLVNQLTKLEDIVDVIEI